MLSGALMLGKGNIRLLHVPAEGKEKQAPVMLSAALATCDNTGHVSVEKLAIPWLL